ncbi:flagellar protein FlaG [Saccharibacillus brassicae]|uniref:Flagellar protein FlaG n=1 Tax=Saccharibacillus brassicae TaxID=2583377 RepID=A0A4Y6UUP9_SACBS|nr:flagellar protein FlaG [Saccharibacillus brassicae]QDH20844.1 flagellar protein FlaG [Saccharibacillus brassicae]
MNLQFSVSASPAGGLTKAVQTSSVSSTIDNQMIQAARNTGELTKLEHQGVSISISDEQLLKTIDRAVKAMQGPETTLEINIHEKTHQLMIKVLNKESGELIREIPPEKTLDLVAKMMEIAGILVDQKV